jgi:hypothetical protein
VKPSFWITWLQVVLAVLFVYALVLVFAGSVAGSIFSALGFGPPSPIATDGVGSYLKLPFMVLGAVLAGWSLMMIQIVRGPLRDGSNWALPALVRSLALWFVLDTGMSVVLGFPMHALFNVPFAFALGFPLWMLKSRSR